MEDRIDNMENQDFNKIDAKSKELYDLIETMKFYQNYMEGKIYILPLRQGEYINE